MIKMTQQELKEKPFYNGKQGNKKFHCKWWGECENIIDHQIYEKEEFKKQLDEKIKEIADLKTVIKYLESKGGI